MSDQHKPLTVAEIEELRELDAKATPEPWAFGPYGDENKYGVGVVMDENDEPVVGFDETEDGIVVESVAPEVEGHANAALIAAMRNALPRLLSMLTPPTDAELREAVEELTVDAREAESLEHKTTVVNSRHLRTLLRAVQAPRLTGKQEAAVREAVEHIGEVLDNVRCHLGICGPGDDGERKADASDNWGILDALDECRTLLRAVQAPRLMVEPAEAQELRSLVRDMASYNYNGQKLIDLSEDNPLAKRIAALTNPPEEEVGRGDH